MAKKSDPGKESELSRALGILLNMDSSGQKAEVPEETRQINTIVQSYKNGFKVAIDGTASQATRQLSEMESTLNLVNSLLISKRIQADLAKEISNLFLDMKTLIISNNPNEKYELYRKMLTPQQFKDKILDQTA
jgi:hypothetical protein